MTTIHLGDCLTNCVTCTDNYHANFKNIECDQCGKFIDGAPICGACGQYEIHENDFDCPAYNSDLCENCYESEKITDSELCSRCASNEYFRNFPIYKENN